MRLAFFVSWLGLVACSSASSGGGGGGGGGYYLLPDGGLAYPGVSDAAGVTPTDGTGGQASGDANPGGADTGGGTSGCVPGATQACLCPPHLDGVQVCKDDGKGWNPCDCGQAPDGGSTATDGGGTTANDTGLAPADGGGSGGEVADDLGNYFDDDAGSPQPDTGGGTVGPSDAFGSADGCIDRAKIIYVVSEENVLLSFNPDTMKLKVVGTLNCPAGFGASPFSMSVDRKATAWVLYKPEFGGAGTIFEVSTLDASCKPTTFQAGSAGLDLFGMGFSANSPGSTDETLFVAGAGWATFENSTNTLATIAFPSLKLSPVAPVGTLGGADLTGNGLGELYGFFPNGSPSVRQIDKVTGATSGKVYPLPPASFSGTQAWAFAQWGGSFYLFFKSMSDVSSNVWQLDGKTGAVKVVLPKIGYTITGAGVSSCAPTKLP